jgi:hypothetical protein
MIRAAVLLLAFAAGGAAAQVTPLPKNLKIVAPDKRDHTLVVERIEGTEVRFICSLGPGIRMSQGGGFQRVIGTIDEKGALRGTLRSGAEVIYRWSGGDKLLAEYSRAGQSDRAILVRR